MQALASVDNEDWHRQYGKDDRILAAINESIKVYMPIFTNVVSPEPAELFQKVFKTRDMDKYIGEERDNFYVELRGAESLLECLSADLDDLKDRKTAAFDEVDHEAFNQKIDDFVKEKNRFISLLDNLNGRLGQIKLALKNYWVFSRYQKKWEETYLKDNAKFQKFKGKFLTFERGVPSTLFVLDAETLSSAAISHANPEALAEILGKITVLEAKYNDEHQMHVWIEPIYQVYSQLYKVKVKLEEYDVMRWGAYLCNQAFNKARNLEKGALEKFQRARDDFRRTMSPNLKILQVFKDELANFRKAAGETGKDAWKKLAEKEAAFLRSYASLSVMVSNWTIPSLADYYDQKYEIPHRAAYRKLLKAVDQKIKLASETFKAVKTLSARLTDGPARAQFKESKQKLETQLQDATESYLSLCMSQEYDVYWEAERDEKEVEAYRVDVEQLSILNQQLMDLSTDVGAILGGNLR